MPASPNNSKPTGQHLIPVLCLVLCGLLNRLPESWQSSARSFVLDSVSPVQAGQEWLAQLADDYRSQESLEIQQLIDRHEQEKQSWELATRQQLIQMAELQERLERRQSSEHSPFVLSEHSPLMQAQVVSAEVLSARQLDVLNRQMLIDLKDSDKIHADQMVLQSLPQRVGAASLDLNLVIDRGQEAGIEASQPVLAGQCVVGKLSDVGHRISRVRLVTDSKYRGRARILRSLDEGYAYGPEGILEGTGEDLCRLRYVSPKLSVRVGDEVYTADPLTSSSVPFYYGRIVKAELEENSHEWSLWIRPGCRFETVDHVQILQEQLAPDRVLAN